MKSLWFSEDREKIPSWIMAMFPRWMRKWDDSLPHQGKKEIARRKRQIERGTLKVS
jgi:hypothetical protein